MDSERAKRTDMEEQHDRQGGALPVVPRPGTLDGPCDEACGCSTCQELRDTAAMECLGCGKEIGYEVAYVQIEDALWHLDCISGLADSEEERERIEAMRETEADFRIARMARVARGR